MAIIPRPPAASGVDYPTRDGRPVGESDVHRDRHFDLVQVLRDAFAADPMVYVSGNLLIFYEPGNKRKHVAPDVFVIRGVPKRQRDNYLVWEEGRAPDLVIELTSRSTRKEDLVKKFELYRDVLRVPEYFLFDPRAEYLDPPLQGHRLIAGRYEHIDPAAGRLPSAVLGLELEAVGTELRIYDPAARRYLPTTQEITQAFRQSEAARQQEAAARQRAEADAEGLRRELEELRRRLGESGGGS
ncbi:MAG TPA: Uma2 family endonuclease [Isosphaeraceae bacterium]|jgi:Uma2 family endonuclease